MTRIVGRGDSYETSESRWLTRMAANEWNLKAATNGEKSELWGENHRKYLIDDSTEEDSSANFQSRICWECKKLLSKEFDLANAEKTLKLSCFISSISLTIVSLTGSSSVVVVPNLSCSSCLISFQDLLISRFWPQTQNWRSGKQTIFLIPFIEMVKQHRKLSFPCSTY